MSRSFFRIFLLSLSCLLAMPNGAAARSAGDDPAAYIRNGGGIMLNGEKTIWALNENRAYAPASILKIATSLAAIRILGKEYRFETRFYLSPEGDLYIEGRGDPYLVSEEVAAIAKSLRTRGLREVRNLYLDESAFSLETVTAEGTGNSLNPYDVMNGALAVNFNTISIVVKDDGSVHSAEPQTPFLPLMAELGRKLPPGKHRISITAGENHTLRYAGELFRERFAEESITLRGRIGSAPPPAGVAPILVHVSGYDLPKVIEGLLRYSNNFVANQLFLTIGARVYGYPASWDKSRKALKNFLAEQLKLDERSIQVEEGSGISRKNRVTPRAMAEILREFMPYADLLECGREGVLLKSGTLTGVYSYAGYFKGGQGLQPFVLMLNQPENTRDTVLGILKRRAGDKP